MKIAPAFLDEIKARVPVSDVVRRRVKLTKKGNEFVGLSPFNNEKTPSFTVNDQKGFYHCFSSQKHGDVISFLMEVEGLNFMEAIEQLATMAGLEMPKPTAQEYEKHQRQKTLYDVMELTAQFFEGRLQKPEGDEARGYLADRGVGASTQKYFRIGYGPKGRQDLMKALKAENISVEMMIEAGVVIGGPDIKEPYDRYRDRVIFPIQNGAGKIAGFGGRALSKDAKAKYINSPETPIYHKGDLLYNHFQARKAAHKSEQVIVVEGYMDVVALHMAGVEHCVAPLGTALTPNQLQLLWRMSAEPILCFDGDKAGVAAAHKAAELALTHLKPGYSLRFVLLPEGQDPDDILRDQGAEGLLAQIESHQSLIDLLWIKETTAKPLDTPERRAFLETRFEDLTESIEDKKIQHHYRSEFRSRLSQLWQKMRGYPAKSGKSQTQYQKNRPYQRRGMEPWEVQHKASSALKALAGDNQVQAGALRREKLLVLGILSHPELLDAVGEEFTNIEFLNADLDRLLSETLDIAAHNNSIDSASLHNHLKERGFLQLIERLESDLSARKPGFFGDEVPSEKAEAGWRHVFALHERSLGLQKELRAAELRWSKESNQENFEVLNDILRQIESVESREIFADDLDDEMNLRSTGT